MAEEIPVERKVVVKAEIDHVQYVALQSIMEEFDLSLSAVIRRSLDGFLGKDLNLYVDLERYDEYFGPRFSSPKRGRPRKYATHAERQRAYVKRKQAA